MRHNRKPAASICEKQVNVPDRMAGEFSSCNGHDVVHLSKSCMKEAYITHIRLQNMACNYNILFIIISKSPC